MSRLLSISRPNTQDQDHFSCSQGTLRLRPWFQWDYVSAKYFNCR